MGPLFSTTGDVSKRVLCQLYLSHGFHHISIRPRSMTHGPAHSRASRTRVRTSTMETTCNYAACNAIRFPRSHVQ